MYQIIFLPLLYLISGALPLLFKVARNFEYEYALLASWSALFVIPLSALYFPTDYFKKKNLLGSKIIQMMWVLLLSPIFVLLLGVLFFQSGMCGCSFNGYFFWMFIIWYPAWIVAHGLFFLILRGRLFGFGRKLAIACYTVVIASCTFLAFTDIWFNPQVRTVNLILGFIHGPIYDTWIPVDSGLVYARVSHLLVGIILILLAWFSRTLKNIVTLLVMILLWGGLSYVSSEENSMQIGKEPLENLLNERIELSYFTVHYKKEKTDDPIPLEIKQIQIAAQFHVEELNKIFNLDSISHIEIYVYPNESDKKLWFGGGSTDVTDVYTPSIHITKGDWNHPTLRHELAHALSASFSFYGLGFHPNMAFTEGLATAVAPYERSVSMDDGAAYLIKNGKIKDVESLFSPLFWKESGSRSYTVSGSLIKYLIDKYGFEGLKKKYSGKSWSESFGRDEASVIAEWKSYILSKYDDKKYSLYSEALYRDPGVLSDVCPHSKEDFKRPRNESIFVRLRQPAGWSYQNNYLDWLETLDPVNKNTKYKKWQNEIKAVIKSNYDKAPRLQQWLTVINNSISNPPKLLEDIDLKILKADLHFVLGELDQTKVELQKLLEYSNQSYLSLNYKRMIFSRLMLLEDLNVNDLENWYFYLSGWETKIDKNLSTSEAWITQYLKVRRRDQVKISKDQLNEFLDLPVDDKIPFFMKLEWYRFLALRLMDTNQFDKSAEMWDKVYRIAPEPMQESLLETKRLAKFYEKKWSL